jgi:hypothetical protein
MKTGDIFLCKVCGLPIRNPAVLLPVDSERFVCETCEVCDLVAQNEMQALQADLRQQLSAIVELLYQYDNRGNRPPRRFMDAVRERLNTGSTPTDKTIESFTQMLQSNISDDDLLIQVGEAERMLAGFYYLSGERRSHVNSKTVLRHWVALVKRLRSLARRHRHSATVLRMISKGRYELGLARLSRLIGDNPVAMLRDQDHYRARGRERHLLGRGRHDHVPALIRQTRGMNPKITGYNLKQILRFAGNAAFITEHDEVIEFRDRDTNNLCKYLLQDEILIVIDDLWFLKENQQRTNDKMPLGELVTIFPKQLAAKQLTRQLIDRRYMPNCVHLPELVSLLDEVGTAFESA